MAIDGSEHAELHLVVYGEVVARITKGDRNFLIAAIRRSRSIGWTSGRSRTGSRRRDCRSSQAETLTSEECGAVESRVERAQVGCRNVLLVLDLCAPFARLNCVDGGAWEEEAEAITNTHRGAVEIGVERRELFLSDFCIVGDAPAAIAGDDLVQSAALALEGSNLKYFVRSRMD
jgi:hypothetical protein